MRAILIAAGAAASAACGRMEFDGYPVRPCDQVVANASFLWSENSHCYTRHDNPVELAQAEAACLSIGGHSVTITDGDENAAVATRVIAPSRLGLVEATGWQWLNEEPVPFAGWAPGQPIACTTGNTSGLIGPDGAWTSACYSSATFPFLCEIEPWLTREEDGHRYRLVWKRQDWFSASAVCQDLGGHLATITSFDEAAFVARIVSTTAWLGASNQAGSFEWITGEPSGSYTAWYSSEPNDAAPACMASTVNQGWVDAPCIQDYRALCEVD